MKFLGCAAACLALLGAACTEPSAGSPSAPSASAVPDPPTTTTTPCEPSRSALDIEAASEASVAGLIALSEAVFDCMPSAVIVGDDDLQTVEFAAETALDRGLPLLKVSSPADLGSVGRELTRLEVDGVVAIGVDSTLADQLDVPVMPLPTPTTTTTPTTIDDSAPTTETSTTTTASVTDDPSTTADQRSTTSTTLASTVPATTVPPIRELSGDRQVAPGDGPVILVQPERRVDGYLMAPAVIAGGGTVAAVTLDDVDEVRAWLDGRDEIYPAWELSPTQRWQLELAVSGTELFGGGTQVFPDRRIVAYYGNPLTFRLGILGETDPVRAVERVTERAGLYNAEGLPPALPGFEIIVTVASTRAGDDGNYSNEMDVEIIRPWIDAAMANGVSVILDLQPGRTDFVTQAKLYEEFLRMPNVGLALDPEWRLKPDQRHLRQIGTVGADEINAVIDYLTQLVHEETLPQKVLILHQFQERMLPDRELVNTPPEIAVVVHVDGQGSLGSKYGTWEAMLTAPTDPDQELWWAWKNFIDEDFPTATPGQVNAVEPLPVIVTYQ